MVGLGFLMLLVAWLGSAYLIRKNTVPRWLLRVLVAMTFSGWVATLAGWYVTEMGRQPWLVSGLLKTADAVTPIASGNVALSLTLYLSVYAVLMVAYLQTLFYMARKSVDVDEYDVNILEIRS